MSWIKRKKPSLRSEQKKTAKRKEQEMTKLDEEDDVVLSYEEEMTLRHASQLPHSSQNYTPVSPSANKQINTVTPTGTLSIESMLHHPAQQQQQHELQRVQSASPPRKGIMKRLSRLSFVGGHSGPPKSSSSSSSLSTSDINSKQRSRSQPTTSSITEVPPLSPPQSLRKDSSPSSSSLIFERSVQDFYSKEDKNAHCHNDDYIPPVLESATSAITDHNLSPDQVDVVSLSKHDPNAPATLPPSPSLSSASNNNNSVSDRYVLSFCSFADIVQSETSEKSLSPPLPGSPKLNSITSSPHPEEDPDVMVTSMSETLRRNTGESITMH